LAAVIVVSGIMLVVLFVCTTAQCQVVYAGMAGCLLYSSKNRWDFYRRNRFACVRNMYHSFEIYHFARKLDRACSKLPEPEDASVVFPGGAKVIDKILRMGPDTYQKKPSNVKQIESLLTSVCGLVDEVESKGVTPLVLDIGAGKALYTRAIYEALDRKVACCALDSRKGSAKDQFYDPPESSMRDADRPFTRVVADVRYLAYKTMTHLQDSKHGGCIAVTKHLCGGATDASLMALCVSPLDAFVGACCFAPCCHQKMKKQQYCNVPFLEAEGFCKTHVGLRGEVQDNDFRVFAMLISMSKTSDIRDFEYKNARILDLLGFPRAQQLGRQARRLLEEGRMVLPCLALHCFALCCFLVSCLALTCVVCRLV
jgi:hypothetical protein